MVRNVGFASTIRIIKHMGIWKAKECVWQKHTIFGLKCKMKRVRSLYVIAPSKSKGDVYMHELIKQMNIAMKSTSESGLVIGEAMKSVLKRLNEGGK